MSILPKIALILIAPILAIGALLTPANPISISSDKQISKLQQQIIDLENKLGSSFPDSSSVVAFFETSLATPLTASGTTMTLVSAADKQGTTLASSTYGFILDEGTASEEIVLADCTGTSCANMERGLDPRTATTSVYALIKAHARGASVKITDAPKLLQLSRYLSGDAGIPKAIRFKTGVSTCADNSCIKDKAYIDATVAAGAADANETTEGIVEIATAQEAASSTSGSSKTLGLSTSITSAVQTGTTTIPVTRPDGFLSPQFIATATASYWFGASTTFSGSPINITGATVNVGTTDFNIGGVDYTFPSSQGASSSVLTLGTGGLITTQQSNDWELLGQTITTGAQATVTVSSLANRRQYMIRAYAPSISTGGKTFMSFQCCDQSYTWNTQSGTSTAGRDHKSNNFFNGFQLQELAGTNQHDYTVFVNNDSGDTKTYSWTGHAGRTNETFPTPVKGAGYWASTTPSVINTIIFYADGDAQVATFGSGAVLSIFGSRD